MARADADQLKIFAGRHSRPLTQSICDHLEIPIGEARTHVFPDGEMLLKVEEDVRGRDCFVVISTCMPVNDNLMELLIFLDCIHRASAGMVTVVLPYFGYGRQDRKSEGRVPITAKLVANLITAGKADRVIAVDLHAAQIQGFFDIPVDHLSATPVFSEYFSQHRDELEDLCLVSPDVGNVKVAEGFANMLGGDLAIINKRRLSGSKVTTGHIIGEVKDKTVLMVDDMISTAGTICAAAEVVMDHGAKRVIAAATHGLFVGEAAERLNASPISKIVVTNTVPTQSAAEALGDKLVTLEVCGLLGDAIHRVHHNKSISELFRGTAGLKR
ncbi:MAG TPA: ribose-phosphate pyrophosphokinase [Phycisphaerales bacterium]|nr:ribose-phosphate pyrophosphokinase [Phycisphaerales bacterium]